MLKCMVRQSQQVQHREAGIAARRPKPGMPTMSKKESNNTETHILVSPSISNRNPTPYAHKPTTSPILPPLPFPIHRPVFSSLSNPYSSSTHLPSSTITKSSFPTGLQPLLNLHYPPNFSLSPSLGALQRPSHPILHILKLVLPPTPPPPAPSTHTSTAQIIFYVVPVMLVP